MVRLLTATLALVVVVTSGPGFAMVRYLCGDALKVRCCCDDGREDLGPVLDAQRCCPQVDVGVRAGALSEPPPGPRRDVALPAQAVGALVLPPPVNPFAGTVAARAAGPPVDPLHTRSLRR